MGKPSQAKRTLARLDEERKKHGITLADIAAEAAKTSKRGTVSVPTVSKVLSGDTPSKNVLEAVARLVDAAEEAARKAS